MSENKSDNSKKTYYTISLFDIKKALANLAIFSLLWWWRSFQKKGDWVKLVKSLKFTWSTNKNEFESTLREVIMLNIIAKKQTS